MGIYKDITDAIKSRIETNWTATAIQWVNTRNKPDPKDYWIQPRTVFHLTEAAGIGPIAENRIVGTLTVNVIAPAEAGEENAHLLVDQWRDLFPRGLVLPTASKSVYFEVPDVREPVEDIDSLSVPVLCPFYAYEDQP